MLKSVGFGVICVISVALFISAGFSIGHSADFNYYWSVQYFDAIAAGVILPRHLPGLWAGLGGYDFFFYGPMPFWVTSALTLPLCSECDVPTRIVVGAAAFWVASGFTCYLFLRRYFERGASAIAALAYCLLPYHLLLDWFVRQALAEFAAYAFVPLVALGMDALRRNEAGAYCLPLGIAGMAICHLPTTLLAAHVFALVALVITFEKARKIEHALHFFLKTALWSTVGVLLASFYWMPALILIDTVANDFLYTGGLVAKDWLFQFAFEQTAPEFVTSIFWSLIAVLPFVVLSAVYADREVLVWIFVPVVLAIFLNNELSTAIWDNWIIQQVQFPWRLMVFVDFSAAVGIAVLISQFRKLRRPVIFVCGFLSFVSVALVLKPSLPFIEKEFTPGSLQRGAMEYFSPEMVHAMQSQLGDEINQWTDKDRVSLWTGNVIDSVNLENAGEATITISHRAVRVVLHSDLDEILVPIQYWAFWEAHASTGAELVLTADKTRGVISVAALQHGARVTDISLRLPYHWSEKLGFLFSALGAIVFVFALFPGLVKTRR